MPPPKRPKSDVHWTTLCAEAERNCFDVAVGCRSASVNEHHVDDSVATSNNGPSASAAASECLRDGPAIDVASARKATGDEGPSGSRQLTSLRRLLLEPVAAASDLRRSPTSSSPASPPSAAVNVVDVPSRCLDAGRESVAVPAATAARRGRRTDVGPSRNLPSTALRRILLNEDGAGDSHRHPQPPVTRAIQSAGGLMLRHDPLTGSGCDVARSLDSATSAAVARAAPQQCDNHDSLQTASTPSSYSQLISRIESRDSGTSDLASKSSELHRSLKDASFINGTAGISSWPPYDASRHQPSSAGRPRVRSQVVDKSPNVTDEGQDSPSSTVDGSCHKNELQYHCQVCEDIASGFHYGVWSCEGCKAFFKRSLQGPSDFVCPATNNCTIDKLRRKSCQACRLEKCYKVGMSAGNCRRETQYGKQKIMKRKLGQEDHVNSTDALKNTTAEAASETNHTSLQQSTVNDTRHDLKPASQPQNPRDSNSSIAEPRARACQLAEYLQRKTRLQMYGVEFGLNSHQCSQATLVLTTTLKLIGNCVDDVISWAKAIPGFSSLEFSSRMQLLLSGWPDVIVLDTAWRSLFMSGAVTIYSGFTLTRHASEVMGCASVYTQLLAIIQTFKHLQLTFNEFVLLRCEALLNADTSVLYTDAEAGRLRSSLEMAWQLLFDGDLSHYQRCMKLLLTLTHVRHCGVELTSWLAAVSENQKISFCDVLLKMLHSDQWDCNQ